MGSAPLIPLKDPRVVRLPAERAGESEVIRNSVCGEGGLVSVIDEKTTTLYENFAGAVEKFGDSKFMGWRENDGPFKWMTYKDADTKMKATGSGLINIGIEAHGGKVGIYSRNTPDWVIAEQACNAWSLIVVPLYDTLGPSACKYIINQSEITTVLCTKDKIKLLLESAGECKLLKNIVQFEDGIDDETKAAAEKADIKLMTFAELQENGTKTPQEPQPPKPDEIATFCYTSGTTGDPKGVMLSHKNFIADVAGTLASGFALNSDDLHISYLPLAHVFERLVQVAFIHAGASIGFYRGDIMKLFDDIQQLKPTVFVSVPRLFNRLYDKIKSAIETAGGIKKTLFETGFNAKKAGLAEGYLTHTVWDFTVFSKIAAKLGGRVRLMLTGSAPISSEVLNFLRICFSCPVLEGYGQTENSAAACVTHPTDLKMGTVGIPVACNEIKLVDIPAMGYLAADKPYPRGEICIRGPNVTSGYYKMEKKTADTIDEHGWLHTGDVGCIDEKGFVSVIDRKKNIFKLSQGEYVAPEKIENIYAREAFVLGSFVHGESLESKLIAIIVPDPDAVKAWAKTKGLEFDMVALCKNEELKKEILGKMTALGKSAGLKGFELARAIYLHPEPFKVEDDIITPTFKLKRPQAKAFFKDQLAALYAGLNTK